ncbi:MAG: hypothetical protein IT378_11695 [Sandaracinaceae bacterium]|nr:hypothetical protein [Sandaracinaceae bacterium]
MRTFELPAGGARERGRAHGEHYRGEIHAIAALRAQLCVEQGRFRTIAQVLESARLHLPVLERFDAPLHEELLGVAEGAGLDPARIVVLNHYTDLKDLDPDAAIGEEDDCSAVVAGTVHGAVLGQTWDMHGSAAPFVTMLKVPASEDRPAAWTLSITGCLGMAGLNASGVGVTINNLRSLDARLGVVWPALVRRMLGEAGADRARQVLLRAPMSSGHHYLVADRTEAFGVETSGRKKEQVFHARFDESPNASFVHTNHCVGVDVASVSTVSPTSTTKERYAWLSASLARAPIRDRHDLWARLGSHEGHPRGVCTHLASEAEPHAMLTCGGIVMDLEERALFGAAGCLHGVEPERFDL